MAGKMDRLYGLNRSDAIWQRPNAVYVSIVARHTGESAASALAGPDPVAGAVNLVPNW